MTTDKVWKLPEIVNRYLSYRAAIPLAQEQVGVMTSILKTREPPVESFLDLGCGDGVLTAAILGEYPTAQGVLADFSEPMLVQAREQLKEYADQLVFESLDYGSSDWVQRMQVYSPFDAIVSGYSIHHQPDERKRQVYDEIYSLLSPGGWFVNIEHVSSAAQLNIDLFEHHYVSARYAIEKQQGGPRTFEQWRSYILALNVGVSDADEAAVDALVAPGTTAVPNYLDPSYPVEGRPRRA